MLTDNKNFNNKKDRISQPKINKILKKDKDSNPATDSSHLY